MPLAPDLQALKSNKPNKHKCPKTKKKAQNELASIHLKEQTEYIQNQIDKFRDSVEDRQSRIAWQTINEVSRRKSTTKAKLKAANQQKRIKQWKQHFENLLGNPPKVRHESITGIIWKQLDIKLGPFTQEELDSVLRKIKNRKAAGLEKILPEAYGVPKETVAAITILYRNTKVKVRSPDGDTDYFDIVAGVLQGDTLAPYLIIICRDYVLRTSIDKITENGFELTKKEAEGTPQKQLSTPTTPMTAILANTPNQAEALLHRLEQAAVGIGLHVNAYKTEYMCFNQTGDIATLDGSSLKLVDKFTSLGSSVSSTEKDIDTRQTKEWTAIDKRSII